jgi:hypothetical protein
VPRQRSYISKSKKDKENILAPNERAYAIVRANAQKISYPTKESYESENLGQFLTEIIFAVNIF